MFVHVLLLSACSNVTFIHSVSKSRKKLLRQRTKSLVEEPHHCSRISQMGITCSCSLWDVLLEVRKYMRKLQSCNAQRWRHRQSQLQRWYPARDPATKQSLSKAACAGWWDLTGLSSYWDSKMAKRTTSQATLPKSDLAPSLSFFPKWWGSLLLHSFVVGGRATAWVAGSFVSKPR